MKQISGTTKRSVLISGASIAGPALAYWLAHYGFDITVVERADAVRSGGYPIDIRGSAVDVVERMGLFSQLRAATIDTRKITFVDSNGAPIAMLHPEALSGGVAGRDIELPRGILTALLYAKTSAPNIRYRFGDSINSLQDDGVAVYVRFKNSDAQRFDIVIAADGLHSNTRALVFGPEKSLHRYLGRCFALFSMPNFDGLSHESVSYAEPGRMAAVYAVGDSDTLQAILVLASDERSSAAHPAIENQRALTAKHFAGAGWKVPEVVDAMRTAPDLYFDTVSQIRMPVWSRGRVALVGDAAYAPSFLSGQGTSLALVGAYVLAGELASYEDPVDAFASYERIVRPFVEANQDLASTGDSILLPRTQDELNARNAALAAGAFASDDSHHATNRRDIHILPNLPDYGRRQPLAVEG